MDPFVSHSEFNLNQLGRSPHDFSTAGDSGEQAAHRSSDGSFSDFLENSPRSVSMQFNLSDGASSDNSYAFNFAAVDPVAIHQMSNDFTAHQDLFPENFMLGQTHPFQGSSAAFASSLASSAVSFGQTPQLGQPPRYSQLHHAASINATASGQVHNHWINSGRFGGPSLKAEPQGDEDLISPTSLVPPPPQNQWSGLAPPGFPGQHFGCDPSDGLTTSYPPSILSHDSSPHVEGIATPDSSRSPMFHHVHPYSSSVGSSGGSSTTRQHNSSFDFRHQQTPRAAQNSFDQTLYNVHQQDLAGISTSHSLLIDQHGSHQAYREASYSPIGEQFVMVDISDAQSISTVKKGNSKSTKRVPPSKMRQDQSMFITEPYPPTVGHGRRKSSDPVAKRSKESKRAGGRSVGMHLTTEAAARAKQLRDEGSCWICCFQRDSCTPGSICDRCEKRSQRAQMEHGLGCDRTKLTDLRSDFIPDFLARSGDKRTLHEFMGNHIRRWSGKSVKLRINIVWGQQPLTLELYEFEPKTAELVRHLHGVLDARTGKRHWVNKGSPPLALPQIEQVDRQMFERYISDITENPQNLERFVERCYKFEKDDFQRRIFRLMFDYKPESKDEKLLLREIFRLLIITYIYARASTIMNGDLHLLSTLHYTTTHGVQWDRATAARLANRQLKYIYTSLWTQTMESVLKKVQQVLRSSRGGAKWSSAFCAVLGLAMAFESIQYTAHTHQEADELMGNVTDWEGTARAENACRVIDDKFFFLATLFRWKYHRGFNPFKDISDPKVQAVLGPKALEFVQGVRDLVAEKSDYLEYREHVAILKDNKDRYTSRLVARFLLTFYKPSA